MDEEVHQLAEGIAHGDATHAPGFIGRAVFDWERWSLPPEVAAEKLRNTVHGDELDFDAIGVVAQPRLGDRGAGGGARATPQQRRAILAANPGPDVGAEPRAAARPSVALSVHPARADNPL